MLRRPEVVISALADQLDITLLEVARLLCLSDNVPVAAWGYDERTKQERIWLNRSVVARLPDDELMWIIRHEVLHRAGYHEGYEFEDDWLGNLALDVAINKILTLAQPEVAVRVGRHVYPEEAKQTALCLAMPHVKRAEVSASYQQLWDEVWGTEKIPNVYMIYFALKNDEQQVKNIAQQIGAGMEGRSGDEGAGSKVRDNESHRPEDGGDDRDQQGGGDDERAGTTGTAVPVFNSKPEQLGFFDLDPADNSGEVKVKEDLNNEPVPSRPKRPDWMKVREAPADAEDTQVLDRAIERDGSGHPVRGDLLDVMKMAKQNVIDAKIFSNTFSQFFGKQKIDPEATDSLRQIEDFLSQIRTKEQVDEALSRIFEAVIPQSQLLPYPQTLSVTGVLMEAVGVSEAIGLWWNETPKEGRPRMRIYVDTSPSMFDWAKRTVYMIERLKDELPAETYAFAGSVVECTTEDFARGEYYKGNSTDFNAVIDDLVASDVEIAVVITDGYSEVDARRQKAAQGKRIFSIFLGSDAQHPSNGRTLRVISEDAVSIFK